MAERAARLAGPVIVLAAGIAMLAWTWFKWPDPLVDFGRELYVPWQLSQGKVLYRDIAYFNGPVSPYFNAVVFHVLGVGLRSLVSVNLLILGSMLLMIWRLWVVIADRLAATLACVLVVTVFAFLQFGDIGNYNFVTPYSHELTHGMALSLGAMLCLGAYLREPRSSWVMAAGLLVGLVFLTKPEVFLAASTSITTGLAAALWVQGATLRRTGRVVTQFAVSTLFPPLLAFLLLSTAMPPIEALRGTLGSWIYLFDPQVSGLSFYSRIFGTLDLASNLYAMLVGLIWWGALFGGVGAVALRLRRRSPRRGWMWWPSLAVMGIGMWMLSQRAEVMWDLAFRGLSLEMLMTTIGLLVVVVRDRRDSIVWRTVVRLVVTTFALLMLAKMFLNVTLWHYGFALAMPATLVMVALLASWWPNFIDRRGGCGIVMRAAAVAAAGLVIWTYLHQFSLLSSDKRVLVSRGGDAFWSDAMQYDREGNQFDTVARGHAVNLALETLSRLPREATLATIPEGIMINYLSRRTNPTPYINLMPPEVLMFGQDRILDAFRNHPPDYVLYVQNSSSADFGFKSFREDYGRQIFQWITENYEPVATPTEPSYPIVLLERTR